MSILNTCICTYVYFHVYLIFWLEYPGLSCMLLMLTHPLPGFASESCLYMELRIFNVIKCINLFLFYYIIIVCIRFREIFPTAKLAHMFLHSSLRASWFCCSYLAL